MGPSWLEHWSTLGAAMQRWWFICAYALAYPRSTAQTLQRPDGARWRVFRVPESRIIYVRHLPPLTARRGGAMGAEPCDNVVLLVEPQSRRAGHG
ncbi:MAG: hypothetical protein ACT4NU_06045 [Chromatiales bacterium]